MCGAQTVMMDDYIDTLALAGVSHFTEECFGAG